MSLTKRELYKSDLLNIRYVACRSAQKSAGDIERSNADTLVLPLRGAFLKHISSENRILAEPNVALLFAAARPFRISHPVTTDDDCLAVEFSPAGFREVLSDVVPSCNLQAVGTHCLLSPPAMASRNLLWRRLERKFINPIEIEETGIALLRTVLLRSCRKGQKSSPDSFWNRSKILQRIEEAKITLLTNPEMKWTLTSLAERVESSPFHLTRMFRQQTGLPLHQYQLRMRLARALDVLLNTNQELTEIALDLGFSSHSHFTAVFHRLVGLSPREFRRVANSAKLAETRKILIARLSSTQVS